MKLWLELIFFRWAQCNFAEVQKISSAISVTEYLTGKRYSTDGKDEYFAGQKVADVEGAGKYFSFETAEKIETKSSWYDPTGMLEEFGIIQGEEVDPQAMLALLQGKDPRTGKSLFDNAKDTHMPGTEIATSAPKSVSAIWACAPDDLRLLIDLAIQQANTSALNYVQAEASYTRYGKDGVDHKKAAFAGAIFPHGSARGHADGVEGDPHRHNHNLTFNLTKGEDGKWRTLENKYMHDYQKAIGAHFRAGLAIRLKDMGFEIERTQDGAFRVVGVPQELVKRWSTRNLQIKTLAAEMGVSTNNKAAMDKIQTKSKADKIVSLITDAYKRWISQAKEYNFDAQSVRDLVHAKKTVLSDTEQFDLVAAQIKLSLNEIVETESLFTRAQLITKITENLTGVLSEKAIIKQIDKIVSNHDIVFLGTNDGELKRKVFMSTTDQVAIEAALPGFANRLSHDAKHFIATEIIEKAIAKKVGMSEEQANAVKHALSIGSLKVVVGDAGVGKTFSAEAINDALADAGYHVHAIAPQWKAAKVMEEDLELTDKAKAIAGFINSVEKGDIKLTAKDAILIDEAGMVGTRTMHKLLKIAEESGCKLILTGDHKQLNAIEAGSGMKIVLDHADAANISTIRRQYDEWDRDMVTDLASGNTAAGIKALDEHGGIKFEQNDTKLFKALIDDWSKSTQELNWTPATATDGDKSHLILAVKNDDVLKLNEMVRDVLRERGLFKSEDITVTCQPVSHNGETVDMKFAIGDRIVLRLNKKAKEEGEPDREHDLITNKDEALIIDIEPSSKGGYDIKIKLDNGRIETLNTKSYVDKKTKGFAATHAYAVTMYASQGMTVRRAFAVADGMGQRYSYVGLSRHKESVTLYANAQSLRMKVAERLQIKPNSVTTHEIKAQLIKQMSRKTDKLSTLDFTVNKPTLTQMDSKLRSIEQKVAKVVNTVSMNLASLKQSVIDLKNKLVLPDSESNSNSPEIDKFRKNAQD